MAKTIFFAWGWWGRKDAEYDKVKNVYLSNITNDSHQYGEILALAIMFWSLVTNPFIFEFDHNAVTLVRFGR